jgi:hypothetical protein
LGARFPLASSPRECGPESIGLLVLEAPEEFTEEWRQVLAPGALVVTRNAQRPVVKEGGAVNVILEVDAGISLDLCEGGHSNALRAILEECANRADLTDAIVQMALMLQSKHAHVTLPALAATRRDAPAATPAAAMDFPLPDLSPIGAAGIGEAGAGSTDLASWPIRLVRWLGVGRKAR